MVAIWGTIDPLRQSCLESLTFFVNNRIAGKLPTTIALWLCGAPLTALKKKYGGFRPIGVGESIRRLASRLCCLSVRPSLEVPYGQVRVGIWGGLDVAVHTVRSLYKDLPDLFSWAVLSYQCAGELRFGKRRLLSKAGVQQGDPLCPLHGRIQDFWMAVP